MKPQRKLEIVPSVPTESQNETTATTSTSNHSKLASYADLFERLLDSTFLVDQASLTVLAANPAAERAFEKSADALKGGSILNFVREEEHEEFKKFVRRAMRKYYPSQMVCRWHSPGPTPYVMEVMACGLMLQNQQEVLQLVARDITYQSEIERRLMELTITDELTQIANVRHFKNTAKEEHQRAVRYKRPYAIILCDVDNFKHYNDTNGHPAGDRLLKELAGVLSKNVRTTDLLARYGGEEFVILCREAAVEDIIATANRICEAVRTHPFEHREKQPLKHVSLSMGLASYPQHGETLEQVIEHSDKALYESKRAGRDRFTVFKK